MPYSTLDLVSALAPQELEYVLEKGLVGGPFSVEDVAMNDNASAKLVTIKFKSGRKQIIEVPLWRTSSRVSR